MSTTTDVITDTQASPASPGIPPTLGQPHTPREIEESSSPESETTIYPSGLKLWLALSSVLMVSLAKGLDTTIVAVTVPSLTDEFKTVKDIGWYSSASGLALSAFTFFFGKLYTQFPLRPLFLASTALFTLASLTCTLAPSSPIFIFGRALSGLASAGISTGAIIILSLLFPLQKRPLWLGIVSGIQSIALVAAPLVGGALIDRFSWRACFGVNLPVCACALGFMVAGFRDPNPQPAASSASAEAGSTLRQKLTHLDLPGTLLIIPSITSLLLALQWGGIRYGWSSGPLVALLTTFGVLIVLFAILQYKRGEQATIPLRLLKNRNMLAGAWFQACCDGTLAATEYYLAIYFQGVRGFSAAKSGALGLPMIVGLMISAIASGWGTSVFGYYTPFMLASSLLTPIPSGILTTLSLTESLAKPLACLAFLGAAVGLGINGPFSAAQTVLALRDLPLGNAMLTFGGGLGSSLFVSGSAALFQRRLAEELGAYAPGTNVTRLEHVGLSDIRGVVGAGRLGEVLAGYDAAVVQTLFFPVALACAGVVGSAVMEWRSMKVKTS